MIPNEKSEILILNQPIGGSGLTTMDSSSPESRGPQPFSLIKWLWRQLRTLVLTLVLLTSLKTDEVRLSLKLTGSYPFRISEEAANYVKPGDLLVRTDTPRNLVRGAGEKFPIVQVTDIGGSVSSEYAKFEGFNITTGYTLK